MICSRTVGEGFRSNLVRAASTSPGSFYMQGETVQFAPVVTRPEKIIMMGFNSRRHAEELGITVRHRPMSVHRRRILH